VAVHPRALPTGLAALVVAAGLVSVVPAATGSTPSQAVLGAAAAPRILAFGGPLRAAAAPATGNTGREVQLRQAQALALLYGPDPAVDASDAVGPFIVSGPRYVAVAPDAAARLRHYRIRSGDTLVTIARQFHVSVSTIWWANRLTSPTRLPVGKTLTIPPVNGLVIVVAAGDTLQSIAEATNVDVQAIVDENQLPNDEVFVGQTLIVPGAKGAPLPQPKPKPAATTPAPKPAAPKRVSISGGWVFPVVGGGAYISQYFHASHPAIDIAADYGTPVRAAHAGTVIFAGWKNNGGGWQVWMSHGSNVYTTYNHMSSLTVHTGQTLGAGQQVGRIGQSGWATGPHCHFEVWIGPIWNGGTRVNPLNYV
jgi:murein DD-endopeptidase MepM/ murein hydrolase activator NlpD